jgi:hypothetical protein
MRVRIAHLTSATKEDVDARSAGATGRPSTSQTRKRGASLRRLSFCLLLVALVGTTLLFSSTAAATTTPYWGYNNMTQTNPPAGTCPSWLAGTACSGWNNWDRSQIQITSGTTDITYGFINCTGCLIHGFPTCCVGIHTLIRSDYNDAYCAIYGCVNTYNTCIASHSRHDSGYAYLQARTIIF